MKYKDLRVNRKDVLKIIREHCVVSQIYSYSEPRKDHQRVKWYAATGDISKIKDVLKVFGYDDVVVEERNNRYQSWARSIVLRFPYSDYK